MTLHKKDQLFNQYIINLSQLYDEYNSITLIEYPITELPLKY